MARYAAIDIGSNSMRMQVAEVLPGVPKKVLATEREVTRLGESVFRSGSLSEDAIQRACGVLSKMAGIYRKCEVVGIRAVATSAVRDTRNQREFLERASLAAGTPVEIISGREESRLIHLGIHSTWPQNGKRILVIDIGGGSAEIISGEGGHMLGAISKPLGALRLKEIFLKSDPPTRLELHQLSEFIEEKLGDATRQVGTGPWGRAIATSATAAATVSAIHRMPRSKRDEVDRFRASHAQIRSLYTKLSVMNLAQRRKVTGIGPSRAEIIVPGVAVLMHALGHFDMSSMYHCSAGVRDGIIADLAASGVGRELSRMTTDQRREVRQLSRRYGVSQDHARKVAEVAGVLFQNLQPLHGLPPGFGRLLEAAAYLHDTGHYVNAAGHHKHSYYIVSNSDLSGFQSREREFVANLCRYHRKAVPSGDHSNYQGLSSDERRALGFLIPLLRLADNLDRDHNQRVRNVDCQIRNETVVISIDATADIDLEEWAAGQAADVFRQAYGKPFVVVRSRPT